MPDYTIGRLRGKCCIVWYDAERKRHRHALGTSDPRAAALVAPSIYAELTRPRGTDVRTLWEAYCLDKQGRAVVATMRHTWKAIRDRFGGLAGDGIAVADCRGHIDERRKEGIQDGTIHTELGHLRMVLLWAEKHGLIAKASYIERPPKPKPKEAHLSRELSRCLRAAATVPHVKLYIILAQTTGARNAALLGLTWDRVNFGTGQIDLCDPFLTQPHKGRAIVPMNNDARAALLEAKQGAQSPYVIEWAGKRVQSVKRGLQMAATKAGLGKVTPHMLRRSAAIHMVESGVTMEEVSQFLGHSDLKITYSAYARFSPTYLQKAAEALCYDDLAEPRAKLVNSRAR